MLTVKCNSQIGGVEVFLPSTHGERELGRLKALDSSEFRNKLRESRILK